jgi:FkbM family methyltransferase
MLNEIIKKDDLVFDVGCNIGGKSEKYLGLGAFVVGFEPQPKCIDKLLLKFNGNNNFKLEPVALDSKKGIGFIYESNADTISSMSLDFIHTTKDKRFKGHVWNNKLDINIDTLDNMINKHGRPSFIKIDVEGYEYQVLSGLSQSVNIISIEFTPELCESSIQCIEYIDKLNCGESIFNYGSRENDIFTFKDWVDKSYMVHFLKSINDFEIEFGDIYIKKYDSN